MFRCQETKRPRVVVRSQQNDDQKQDDESNSDHEIDSSNNSDDVASRLANNNVQDGSNDTITNTKDALAITCLQFDHQDSGWWLFSNFNFYTNQYSYFYKKVPDRKHKFVRTTNDSNFYNTRNNFTETIREPACLRILTSLINHIKKFSSVAVKFDANLKNRNCSSTANWNFVSGFNFFLSLCTGE